MKLTRNVDKRLDEHFETYSIKSFSDEGEQ